jgi:pilus assembly protein CpaB
VIAVGRSLSRSNGTDTQPAAQAATVITLLVSPDDAHKLALASQEGRIQLALRNPLDTHQGEAGATKASSLFGSDTPKEQPKLKAHKTVQKPPVTAPPPPYSVETIRGSKRDEAKFEPQ